MNRGFLRIRTIIYLRSQQTERSVHLPRLLALQQKVKVIQNCDMLLASLAHQQPVVALREPFEPQSLQCSIELHSVLD